MAPSPEAYHAGRALHRAAMIPPMPKQRTAAATDSLKPESSGHSHHRAESMTPTRRRVSVNQSIPPESNEHSLRREEKMSPTRRRVLVKQSIPEATNSMIMSMKTSEKSTPMVPSEMSIPTGTIDMSMPIELSEMSMSTGMTDTPMPIELSEISIPMKTIEMSMPIVTSEMSMSIGTIEMSMSIVTSEMSMSMGIEKSLPILMMSEMSMSIGTIEMSMPILISEMSMSMGMSEMSMPIELSEMSMSIGTIEMSMPILISEMSMSMGMIEMSMPVELSEMSISLGTIEMSMPIELSEMSMTIGTSEMSIPTELSETSMSMAHNDEVSASPTSRPTRHLQTSVPTSSEPSTSPTYNPSTPWPSYVPTSSPMIALGESSSSIVLDPTVLPSSSPATKMPTTKTSTVLPSKLPTLLPSKLPTKSPTQSPITNAPTTSSPVVTVAPTRSHSASPLPGVISVETITQLQLMMSASPTSRPTRHLQTSVPTSSEPSTSPTYNPSTPWPSYVPTSSPMIALGESSSSIVLDPTVLPSSSPATKMPTTKTSTVLPSKLPTLLPSKLPTKSPTQSPITNAPTTSSPVVTVAPTRSHSASPLPGVISVETITQLQLIGMYATMNVKASDIFKQSCISFLEEYLAEAQPPTFTVNCEVTKQQLLSGRRLRAIRGLEGESSLLVDVSVKGNDNATKSAMEASNIHFNDQVIETFAMHSSEFVEQLQEDGIEAGVLAFDRLTSTLVYPTGGDVSEIVESPDGSKDSESNGNTSQNLAIATMTVSGIVVLGVFAFIFYRVRNNESIYDEPSESESSTAFEVNDVMFPVGSIYSADVEVNDIMFPVGSIYSADQTEKRPDVTPIHAGDITYKYSLEDGLASPESIVSQKPFSPMNLLDWMKGEEPLSSNRKKLNMLAPPGKLGIIIDTCSEGPIVHNIKDGSALEGLIFKGDLIVAVDDEDTTEWSAHYLTKLVAKKSNLTRKITVLRTDMN